MIFLISLSCLSSVSADDSDSIVLEPNPSQADSILDSSDSQDLSQDPIQEGSDSEDSNEKTVEQSTADSSEESDVSSSNKKSTSNVLGSANIELDNDADKENIRVGELVTWILEAKNFGPDIGKNVKVFDKLPSGLKFIKYTATKGTFDIKTGIWDIGDLEPNQTETLYIVTKALTTGEKINKANLTSDTNITNPDECYEEEGIDVLENSASKATISKKIIYSKQLPRVGNPIFLVIISLMSLLVITVKRD